MDIAWYGHAAFRLRGREASVVTDPCPAESGFRLNRPNADIVTVSNPRSAHSWVDGVQIEPSGLHRPLNAPGEYEVKRVLATGVETPGPDGRRNIAFVITIDDVIVAHLGDVREMPSPAALEELQRASVCLLPVGGGEHIGPELAAKLASVIAAPLIIPMLYQPEGDSAPQTGLDGLGPFLRAMGVEVEPPTDNHINVTTGNLPATPTVQPLLARGA